MDWEKKITFVVINIKNNEQMKISSILKWILVTVTFIVGAYGVWTTLGRTIIKTSIGWLLVVVIGGLSALLAYWSHRNEPETKDTGRDICGDFAIYAIILCGLFFSVNYYFPVSTLKRKAVIQNIYKEAGKRKSYRTHYVLKFEDNGQREDIYGGLSKYKLQKGDTVTTVYQHGFLGLDIVTDLQY